MNNIQYYLIHGVDKQRAPRMMDEFQKWQLNNNNNVKWILEPNRDKIDENFRNNILIQDHSFSCGNHVEPKCPNVNNGQISCTYKHYLCLKDIVENNYEYGVIMEDNQFFCDNIPKTVEKYIIQLNNLYPEWDIIFDTKWKNYKDVFENELKENKCVYPKSNEITPQGLAFMTHQEMNHEKWQDLMEKKRILDANKFNNNIQASTNLFTCGKCKSKRCTYYSLQTRSSDEPETIFVTCLDCGKNFKKN